MCEFQLTSYEANTSSCICLPGTQNMQLLDGTLGPDLSSVCVVHWVWLVKKCDNVYRIFMLGNAKYINKY